VHGPLNVATGQSRSIRDIAELIGRVLGIDFEIVEERSQEDREFDLVFDPRRLKALIPAWGFTELEQGIATYREALAAPLPR
jgi:nucleoside-diphosphate-sugar epimerase